jgi:hypothetical protein
MRVSAGTLALACLFVAACRMPASALTAAAPSPSAHAVALSCPEGKPPQPGLTDFGAYIGTWQALHQRVPQSTDYAVALVSGKVAVRCSPNDYVIFESINLTFQVPSGRALQFALTELPADSKRIYDHEHAGCRTLEYQSHVLATQLPRDDQAGLADITLSSPATSYNTAAVSQVVIRAGTSAGADVKPCVQT